MPDSLMLVFDPALTGHTSLLPSYPSLLLSLSPSFLSPLSLPTPSLSSLPPDPAQLAGVSADSARRAAASQEGLCLCGAMSALGHCLPLPDSRHLHHTSLLHALSTILHSRYEGTGLAPLPGLALPPRPGYAIQLWL